MLVLIISCVINGGSSNPYRLSWTSAGTISVSTCFFQRFFNSGKGGAIYAESDPNSIDVSIMDSSFFICESDSAGGAIYCWIPSGKTTMRRTCSHTCGSGAYSDFFHFRATYGSTNLVSYVSITNAFRGSYTFLLDNSAQVGEYINSSKNSIGGSVSGGHFCYFASVVVKYCSYSDNNAAGTGVLFVGQSSQSSSVQYCNFVNNRQQGSGSGVIRSSNTALTVSNSYFGGNLMTVFNAESGSLTCSYSVICQGMGTIGNVNLNNNAYPNDVQTMSLSFYQSIVCHPNYVFPVPTRTLPPTPRITPLITPLVTPLITPIITPVFTEIETPQQTMKETLSNTIEETLSSSLSHTMMETPNNTPIDTFGETPNPSPEVSEQQTEIETLIPSFAASDQPTPIETLDPSPSASEQPTNIETIFQTTLNFNNKTVSATQGIPSNFPPTKKDQSIIGDLSMSTIIGITLGSIVILSVTIISINCKCNTADDDSGGVIYRL